MEKHLAPWTLLNNLEAYHGDLTAEEKYHILSQEPPYSYIITDYNPNRGDAQLKITVLCENRIHTVLSTLATTLTVQPSRIYHTVDPKTAHISHEIAECDFTTHFKFPVKRRAPHSLKSLARGTICENLSYKDIEKLAERKTITQEIKKYIMEKSSTTQPTKSTMLFCDVYDPQIYD